MSNQEMRESDEGVGFDGIKPRSLVDKKLVPKPPRISDAQLNTLILSLAGTCQTMSGALALIPVEVSNGMVELSEDDLTRAQLETIDEEIFCCEACGWWCGVEERSDDEDATICQDCAEDNK